MMIFFKLLLLSAFTPIIFGSILSSVLPSVDILPDGTYTSYVKGPLCQPSDAIRSPKTAEEVVAIVQEAIARGTTVKAFGHRHSITDIICTDGIPVDMREIKGMQLNDDQTATVGAGEYMHDLTTFLRQRGRALKTTPAYGNITVGGAIGTGAHGSSIKFHSSISAQVVGLTIVDGLGNIRNISTEEDLRAFRVHLGLLGIVLTITLSTEPLYKVRAYNYLVSDDILRNGDIINIAKNTDQVTAYWFPAYKKVLIANWTIVDVNTPGDAVTNDHVPPTSATLNSYATPLLEIVQSLNSVLGLNIFQAYTLQTMLRTIPDFVPIYTENGITVVNPAVGYYDLMFAPICYDSGFFQCLWNHGPNHNLTFLDNEIAVSLDKIADFTNTIRDILSKSSAVFPFDGILLRFSANSDTYMSTSQGMDTVHFEFYTIKRKNPYQDPSVGLAAYQAILQTLALNYAGRSHWGKTGLYYHSQEMIIKKLDPAAREAFVDKMDEYDPNGVFINDFGRRLKKNGTKINTDPATVHCALLDNCVCQRNGDCASGQICTRIPGYPDYPVCSYPNTNLITLNPNSYIYNTSQTLNQLVCSTKDFVSTLTSSLKVTLNCPSASPLAHTPTAQTLFG